MQYFHPHLVVICEEMFDRLQYLETLVSLFFERLRAWVAKLRLEVISGILVGTVSHALIYRIHDISPVYAWSALTYVVSISNDFTFGYLTELI